MFSDFVRTSIIFWLLITIWLAFGDKAPDIVETTPDEITTTDGEP